MQYGVFLILLLINFLKILKLRHRTPNLVQSNIEAQSKLTFEFMFILYLLRMLILKL